MNNIFFNQLTKCVMCNLFTRFCAVLYLVQIYQYVKDKCTYGSWYKRDNLKIQIKHIFFYLTSSFNILTIRINKF